MSRHWIRQMTSAVKTQRLPSMPWCVALLAAASCGIAERDYFNYAARTDTIKGYEGFLAEYPSSDHAPVAKARLEELNREHQEWLVEVASAEQKGDIEAMLVLKAPLDRISKVAMKKGRPVPESTRAKLEETFSDPDLLRISPRGMRRVFWNVYTLGHPKEERWVSIPDLWLDPVHSFFYFSEGELDGQSLGPICRIGDTYLSLK